MDMGSSNLLRINEIRALASRSETPPIFLVDPLHAHPHEPDIQGLLRVCNVHDVPLATNLATAELIVQWLGEEMGKQ
jgi:methylglyoxal synthase